MTATPTSSSPSSADAVRSHRGAEPTSVDAARPVDIPALTGLRAFAAVAVVGSHVRPVVDEIAPYPVAAAVGPWLDCGPLGVDVFFVLSGFVIAHTYAQRLSTPVPRAVRSYLIARLARVYPLHLVTFFAWVFLVAVGVAQTLDVDHTIDYTPLGFVGNLLMLQALPGIPAWNFPAWSISCEFAAYLVFPLFAARLLQVRWQTALLLAAVVLSLQLFVLYEMGVPRFAVQSINLPRIVGEFAAGALLWVVWHRVLRPGRWGDAAAMLCLGGAASLLWFGFQWPATIPLLAAMIPAAASATGPVAALLAHPATQWGGRISYALYLVHIPVLAVAIVCVVPEGAYAHHSTKVAVLVLGALIASMVAAAALLHHGVEEPVRHWVRRRFDRGARRTGEILAARGPGPTTST